MNKSTNVSPIAKLNSMLFSNPCYGFLIFLFVLKPNYFKVEIPPRTLMWLSKLSSFVFKGDIPPFTRLTSTWAISAYGGKPLCNTPQSVVPAHQKSTGHPISFKDFLF